MALKEPTSKSVKSLPGLAEQQEKLRRELAQAMVPTGPLAYSLDEKMFGYEAKLGLSLAVGTYVTLRSTSGDTYLGQITTQETALREGPEYGVQMDASAAIIITQTTKSHFVDRIRIRYVHGTGEILGRATDKGIERTTSRDTFSEASIEAAATETVGLYLSGIDKAGVPQGLDVGYVLYAETGRPRVRLQQDGFNRHTFICGQSRSGKTFALGTVLEQILLSENAPRIVILDPNSDFVHLDQIRSKEQYDATRHAPAAETDFAKIASRYGDIKPLIRIVRPHAGAATSLRIRLSDLDRYEQGAVLQLHPIDDLRSFNVFLNTIEGLRGHPYSWQVIIQKLGAEISEARLDLALRIQNLGIADWDVWCKTEEPSIAEELKKDDWLCMVVDVGTLTSAEQRSVATIALLNHLWNTRNQKKPVLLVLDEAHNVCPQEPSSQIEEIATNYIVRIAGEGLKYGLRLLLASQRPAKIHVNVLTQCENLMLMRMNSSADLMYIGQSFSQAPQSFIARARLFTRGESLITGSIVKNPTFVKFEGRITREGGGDAPA